jgi:hypothetical protein
MANKEPENLVKRHEKLTHSDMMKVSSHVQREKDGWFLNTLMIDGCDAPFRYKRKKKYNNLQGQRVNLTYYPASENVAGIDMEVMNVIRVKVS